MHRFGSLLTVMFAGGVTVQVGQVEHVVGKLIVVKLSAHPPEIAPVSPPRSSTKNRLQFPFAFNAPYVPNKVATPAVGGFWNVVGAGAGNVSVAPEFVGLNVPDVKDPVVVVIGVELSCNVNVTLLSPGAPPPTSDSTV